MLSTLINDLRSTTKPSEKLAVIKSNEGELLKWVLEYTYNPFKLFRVKIKDSDIPPAGLNTFEEYQITIHNLLDNCGLNNSSLQNKLNVIDVLYDLDSGSQELLVGIINKNWKAGLGEKNVLEMYPGLFPVFEVQLANSYKVDKKYKDRNLNRIYSYKLDGIRCVALRVNGEWLLKSRQGHDILTCDHIKDRLEKLYNRVSYTFFDGELFTEGMKFEEVQGKVMAFKKGQAPEIDYHIFCCGLAEDFLAQNNTNILSTHGLDVSDIDDIFVADLGEHPFNDETINLLMEEAFSKGYEGLMLRNISSLYDFKRSDALLKIKKLAGSDVGEVVSDCLVTGIVIDKFPVCEMVDGVNTMIYKQLLTKLNVIQKDGKDCVVGSGFPRDIREAWTTDPSLVVGKVIEVLHQECGSNGRMRFPRFYRVREDLTWG